MKVSNKTKALIISLVILLLIGIAFILCFLINKPDEDQAKSVFLYPADYNEDIFANKQYMDLDRAIVYGDDNQLISYDFESVESAPDAAKLFINFFKALVYGDADSYNEAFYNGDLKCENKFTKQMIYDVLVKYKSQSELEYKGETLSVRNFYVSYKIYRNNGTFRRDLRSNTAKPQIYQVYQMPDGTNKIINIIDIKIEK